MKKETPTSQQVENPFSHAADLPLENNPEELPFNRDFWANRTEGMRCSTCMFFCSKLDDTELKAGKLNSSTSKHQGRCRRRAPTLNGYPVVYGNDWCGDHKMR